MSAGRAKIACDCEPPRPSGPKPGPGKEAGPFSRATAPIADGNAGLLQVDVGRIERQHGRLVGRAVVALLNELGGLEPSSRPASVGESRSEKAMEPKQSPSLLPSTSGPASAAPTAKRFQFTLPAERAPQLQKPPASSSALAGAFLMTNAARHPREWTSGFALSDQHLKPFTGKKRRQLQMIFRPSALCLSLNY